MTGRKVSVQLPDDLREQIGDVESLSGWIVDAIRMRLAIADAPRWKPLLGDALSARVAVVAVTAKQEPARWCLDTLTAAVEREEHVRAAQRAAAQARASCSHPDSDRRGSRCGKCGIRGLPAVAKVAQPSAGRR